MPPQDRPGSTIRAMPTRLGHGLVIHTSSTRSLPRSGRRVGQLSQGDVELMTEKKDFSLAVVAT